MNAIMLIPAPSATASHGTEAPFMLPANDEVLSGIARSYDPEPELVVQFVGLSEAEQLKALASFPGATRCRLARA